MNGDQKLPNLIIAGAQKAGTSSLFWYLAQHPQICASDRKELRYFTPRRVTLVDTPGITTRAGLRRDLRPRQLGSAPYKLGPADGNDQGYT
jgi:hypothetical protein